MHGAHAWQTQRRSWEIRAAEVLLGSHSTAGEVRSCEDRWFGRRTAGARRPCGGVRLVVCVDDMNMPIAEVSGAQPPLQLLRTVLVRVHQGVLIIVWFRACAQPLCSAVHRAPCTISSLPHAYVTESGWVPSGSGLAYLPEATQTSGVECWLFLFRLPPFRTVTGPRL